MVSSPLTVNYKKLIYLDEKLYYELINLFEKTPYNPKRRSGFLIKNQEINSVQCYFIYEKPIFYTIYDVSNNSIKKEKSIRKDVVEFLIDKKNHLIEIYSNKQNSKRLLNEIGKLSKFSLAISDITFNPKQIIKKFEDEKINFVIRSLKIRDFIIKKRIIGTYYIRSIENNEAKEIINENNHNISYFGIQLKIEKKLLTIGIYRSGNLRLFNKIENIENSLEELKKLIL